MNEFALIEDGYSVTTTIPRVAGLHPAVKVRFRPALMEERSEWRMRSAADLGGKERTVRACDLLKTHLEQWDIKNRAGTEVRHNDPSVLAKLQPTLFEKILDLILGYEPAKEEDDAKNSLPASISLS